MSIDQTHWVATRQQRPLPPFYYRGHFVELLDFIEQHYGHVLQPAHAAYIGKFRELSRDAQCLYVRLINRKGRIFAADRLRYPELGDRRPLLTELRDTGWIGSPAAEYFDDLLSFLTRSEIYDVLLPRVTGLSRSLKKAELVHFAQTNLDANEFIDALSCERILVQKRVDQTRFLMFLYFGRVQDSLTKFTMRDLGLVRTQTLSDDYEPRFGDAVEAIENYYYTRRLFDTRRAPEQRLRQLIKESTDWPDVNFTGSATSVSYTHLRAHETAKNI